MKKILACLTLVGGLGAACFLETPASAQSKKTAAGSILVKKNQSGKYIFQVRNSEDKLVAQSFPPTGFATEKEALELIDELKKILADVKPTVDKSEPKPRKKAG